MVMLADVQCEVEFKDPERIERELADEFRTDVESIREWLDTAQSRVYLRQRFGSTASLPGVGNFGLPKTLRLVSGGSISSFV